ncbi:hypothetical protein NG895_22185 [Aeoliella sp. ICT_H6.2]|uniref:MoxR-vWA-beta-propeller ternary system domain-containing protein n=1 Tax=Aeoliella straminimaris TaxID=2954799 RepID=A0A9X2JIJ1_9BACT|nr:hypothetical protein [Aeoliella straminimaris]
MLLDFLNDLLGGKQVHVGTPRHVSSEDRSDAAAVIAQFERDYRTGLPGDPPPLDIQAASWAAESMYYAASLVIHRDAGTDAIEKLLGTAPPDRTQAESHYAVDLTMRFLPDLLKLAKSAATDDPLVNRLLRWATDWPLSSVAVESVQQVDVTPLRTSPTLMRLYADRVIAAENHSRLDDPAVAEVVRQVIGDYSELSPRLARKLTQK